MNESDFRPPEPEDRATALLAAIEARGDALPKPPRCHGYANCCECPVCRLPARKRRRWKGRLLAA